MWVHGASKVPNRTTQVRNRTSKLHNVTNELHNIIVGRPSFEIRRLMANLW